MSSVLGRPVTGEITSNIEGRVAQKPGEEFRPLLDDVLEVKNVESVRWTQYTPFFNDGDPCIFTTRELTVKLAGHDTAGDYEDGYIAAYEMVDYTNGYRGPRTIKPGFEGIYPVLNALGEQIEHFEDFLHESFGDHAQATATSEGSDVASYDHD
jgi:hypothetical protein